MIISEWTLLILLMVPLAAFVVGALLIAAWSQTTNLVRTINIVMAIKDHRHSHSILQNASR